MTPTPGLKHKGTVRRVLLVSTYYWPVVGGVETNVRHIARVLRRGGFAPEVLTSRTPPGASVRDEVEGIPVWRLPPAGERRGSGKWLLLPALLAALLRTGRDAAAIVNVDFRATGLAAVTAGRLLKRPVVLQAATPDALTGDHWDATLARLPGLGGAAGRWLKRVAHAPYRAADAYTCVARGVLDEARRVGIPSERLHYTPHFVDVARFRPPSPVQKVAIRRRLGWPADRMVAAFVGRLSREKGVLDLLEAWRRVDEPRALLVLVGPDMSGHALDVGAEAKRFVAAHGLGESVRFEGAAEDVAPHLSAADVFVFPSHYEAFGLAALEAMSCGLPVVASDVGGLPDFVRPGRTGVLVPPRDPPRLAQAIAALFEDSARRSALGERARAVAEAEFSEEVIGARYVDLLTSLAGRP